jgi:hypothetical protein
MSRSRQLIAEVAVHAPARKGVPRTFVTIRFFGMTPAPDELQEAARGLTIRSNKQRFRVLCFATAREDTFRVGITGEAAAQQLREMADLFTAKLGYLPKIVSPHDHA